MSLLHAFHMLCPGCIAHALPQAQRGAELFADKPLAVIGLHTVFEHHDAKRFASLRAFVHEHRIRYPVGVDMPGADGQPIPRTMLAYEMQGTPTTVLIDADHRPASKRRPNAPRSWLASPRLAAQLLSAGRAVYFAQRCRDGERKPLSATSGT